MLYPRPKDVIGWSKYTKALEPAFLLVFVTTCALISAILFWVARHSEHSFVHYLLFVPAAMANLDMDSDVGRRASGCSARITLVCMFMLGTLVLAMYNGVLTSYLAAQVER